MLYLSYLLLIYFIAASLYLLRFLTYLFPPLTTLPSGVYLLVFCIYNYFCFAMLVRLFFIFHI